MWREDGPMLVLRLRGWCRTCEGAERCRSALRLCFSGVVRTVCMRILCRNKINGWVCYSLISHKPRICLGADGRERKEGRGGRAGMVLVWFGRGRMLKGVINCP